MKQKFLRLFFGGILAFSLNTFAAPPVSAATDTDGLSHSPFHTLPYVTLGIGARSGCVRPAKMVITKDAEWRRVWHVHTQGMINPPALPVVDFSRQVVLVLLNGKSLSPDTSLEVAQVVTGPQETLVYYYLNGDDSTQRTRLKAARATQPFHFAAIDKPTTPIRFVNALSATCSNCGKF
ncbi:MAG: hypothetical protein JO316_03550 [Abitibacteriaceae bacterium]|nr:hypothetical protein [Abditibacteriaceae bacterium]MBV9864396.1 hypothetical protein [Abditibacteriaceae bacterium]